MVTVTTRPEPSDGASPEPRGDDPDPDPHEPVLTVAAVARRLGIAPATLRTWNRRYGVGPSEHATGRHRRYDSQDVARLELMQRALVRGASPADAARYALSETRAEQPAELVGRALRLPGAGRLARGFGRAVLAMDSVGAQRLLGEAIEASGVPRVWDDVVRPVLGAIGRRWSNAGAPVELEHLLYECVLAALIRATPLVTQPRNPRPVLLACVPDEQHTLALRGLVATLACRGLGTRMLGPAVPADALAAAIRRTAPAAVVLWAQLPRNADPALATVTPKGRQRTRLFLGGPGWRAIDLDPRLVLADGIGPAADDIEKAVL
jgi:DNA-binding transcriptional MerR regulator